MCHLIPIFARCPLNPPHTVSPLPSYVQASGPSAHHPFTSSVSSYYLAPADYPDSPTDLSFLDVLGIGPNGTPPGSPTRFSPPFPPPPPIERWHKRCSPGSFTPQQCRDLLMISRKRKGWDNEDEPCMCCVEERAKMAIQMGARAAAQAARAMGLGAQDLQAGAGVGGVLTGFADVQKRSWKGKERAY